MNGQRRIGPLNGADEEETVEWVGRKKNGDVISLIKATNNRRGGGGGDGGGVYSNQSQDTTLYRSPN